MSLRITQRLMTQRSLTALQTGLGRLADSQEKVSTGRAINRPSDSPTGTNEAMRLRAQISANAQHTTNAQDGKDWLGLTDSTLTSMLDSVRRAQELMLQGASTGNSGTDAREALATELTQVRDGLLADANTQRLGRPLFSGNKNTDKAYEDTGSFLGDTNAVTRTVGDGVQVRVNITGPEVFSADGTDLFAVLKDAVDQLRNDPAALGASLDKLDAVAGQMKSGLADVGAREARLDTTLDRLSSTALDNHTALSNVENVDIANAVVDLQMQQVAYQASLGATARVLQPSLLDFLK
jgi:flagellar hook-associated protein 3 FlgL